MSLALAGIADDEGRRALDYQQARLDNLRDRFGVLLSAAAVSTAFLGAEVLKRPGTPTATWFAVGLFVSVSVLCIYALQPLPYSFVFEPVRLLDDYVDLSEEETLCWLATYRSWQHTRNNVRIEGLRKSIEPPTLIAEYVVPLEASWRTHFGLVHHFRLASAFLVAETLCWLAGFW